MSIVSAECGVGGGFEEMGFCEQALECKILLQICCFGRIIIRDRCAFFVADYGYRGSILGYLRALQSVSNRLGVKTE